ncbi:MAG: hypothetical protein DRJ45_07110 [Thermoprotei archaeon]|nr:MAG: hypothetical protein DRJ45_07110 [Thermoprotei archaeon]
MSQPPEGLAPRETPLVQETTDAVGIAHVPEPERRLEGVDEGIDPADLPGEAALVPLQGTEHLDLVLVLARKARAHEFIDLCPFGEGELSGLVEEHLPRTERPAPEEVEPGGRVHLPHAILEQAFQGVVGHQGPDLVQEAPHGDLLPGRG